MRIFMLGRHTNTNPQEQYAVKTTISSILFLAVLFLSGCKGDISIKDLSAEQKAALNTAIKESIQESKVVGFYSTTWNTKNVNSRIALFETPRGLRGLSEEERNVDFNSLFIYLNYSEEITGKKISFGALIGGVKTDAEQPSFGTSPSVSTTADLTKVVVSDLCEIEKVSFVFSHDTTENEHLAIGSAVISATGDVQVLNNHGELLASNTYSEDSRLHVGAVRKAPAFFASINKRLKASGLCPTN